MQPDQISIQHHRRSGESARWRHAEAAFLCGVVALVGLERIDFLAGAGPFRLTPFVLTIPFVGLLAATTWRSSLAVIRGWGPRARLGSALVAGFMLLAVISVALTGGSLVAWGRVLLLIGLAGVGWVVVVRATALDRPAVLSRGALIGLGLFVVFNVLQLIAFANGVTRPTTEGLVVDLWVHEFGSGFRLSGGVLDANRAGLLIAIYAYILLADPWTRQRYARRSTPAILLVACFALVVVTLSRSGLVAFFVIALAVIVVVWPSVTWRRVLTGALVAVVAGAILVWLIIAIAPNSALGAALTSRFDLFTDGSALSHFGLYAVGADVLAQHPWSIPFGVGYGNSYLYLGDELGQTYFGPDRPANYYSMFHSGYLTILVEMGIVGLVAYLALTLLPIATKRAPLAVGLALFGIFYQSLSDPFYWLAIALLWVAPLGRAHTRSAAPTPRFDNVP